MTGMEVVRIGEDLIWRLAEQRAGGRVDVPLEVVHQAERHDIPTEDAWFEERLPGVAMVELMQATVCGDVGGKDSDQS